MRRPHGGRLRRLTQPRAGAQAPKVDNQRVADVALISVIASGTVGVLGAAGAFYAQRVSLTIDRHRRHEARLEDLRSILDHAAQAAMKLNVPLEAADDRPIRSYAPAVDQVQREVETHLARIGVRVGPESRVYTEFARIRDAGTALYDALRGLPDSVTTSLIALPPDEIATRLALALSPAGEDAKEELERLQPSLDAVTNAFEEVRRATADFLTASAELLAE